MIFVTAFAYFSALTALFLSKLFPIWSSAIPGGSQDTRLFLWNAWWFRHALDVLHTNPIDSPMLFHPFGAHLISHDFPMFMNLVTYIGQSCGLSLVSSSNLWFGLSWMLAGFCTFGLAREVTGRTAPAFVAGTMVMTHSYMLARALQNWGQFNLYGIALFLWIFVRARRRSSTTAFLGAGVALAWTAACHYYFLMYCVTLTIAVAFYDLSPYSIKFIPRGNHLAQTRRTLLTVIVIAASIATVIAIHPMTLHWRGITLGMESPQNLLFVMWILMAIWIALHWRVSIASREMDPAWQKQRFFDYTMMTGVATILLSPLFWETFKLIREGGYPRQNILWKTHNRGADILTVLTPNPFQIWWGPFLSRNLLSLNLLPDDMAASLGWVAIGVFLWAKAWKDDLKTRHWIGLAVGSTVLAMGTHLRFADHNSWCPLPFFVFRLLPILGNVRVPERWMAVGAIAWSIVLACSIVPLADKRKWSLRTISLIVLGLILVENWPQLPFRQTPETFPVYDKLKALPAGAALTVPLYIGDSSIGTGDALTGRFILPWDFLWGQMFHEKPIVGGYVGRISRKIITDYKADPFIHMLLDLEERKVAERPKEFSKEAVASISTFGYRYVLVYPEATTPEVLAFVMENLPLSPIDESGPVKLYEVRGVRSGSAL